MPAPPFDPGAAPGDSPLAFVTAGAPAVPAAPLPQGVSLMSSQYVDHLVDVSAGVPLIANYVLAGVGAAATLTGYFTGQNGAQASPVQSFSVPTVPTTLSALYNAANAAAAGTFLPLNFLGFIGAISGAAVYLGLGGSQDGTIQAGLSPAAGYPQLLPGQSVAFGRVSPGVIGSPAGQASSTTPAQGSVQRVNAGAAAAGQTLKAFTGKVSLSTTVTTATPLENVTAGKTFYVTDLYLSIDTNTPSDVRLQAAGSDIFRCVVKGDTAPIQMPGIETQPNASSGQAVQILWPVMPAASNGYFYVAGFEQ